MQKNSQETIFIESLEEGLRFLADTSKAEQMSKYMKGLFPFFGVMAADRKAVLSETIKLHGLSSDALATASLLFNKAEREFHICAQEILFRAKKQWENWNLNQLSYFITSKSWWDSVDFIASNLIGGYMKKYPNQANQNTINCWSASDNIWLQRTAIIYQLKYSDTTNTELLAKYITPHLQQKEFFIKKAIGWALREYSKYNSEWVVDFVNQNPMQPLSKKEALRLINA